MKKRQFIKSKEYIHRIADQLACHDLFYGHGTDNPVTEAHWLVNAVITQQGVDDISTESLVSAEQQRQIEELLQRRINDKIPLAYLLQEAWFGGHCFYVDERVLVPRSPLAELIQNHFQPILAAQPKAILDLCCGSGCIGIAVALAFPDSQVVLSDVSAPALAVADINIRRFGLESRIQTRLSDVFAAVTERFDLIVANPPYVSAHEYRDLPAEYKREPQAGLVCGQQGLEIPLQILNDAAVHLNAQGMLILETGYSWSALQQSLPQFPFLWLEFEFGGEGVAAIGAQQLQDLQHV